MNLMISLYSHANVRVRTSKGETNSVPVAEGVLQGELLSPGMFSCYLSDIVSFFQSMGLTGISISSLISVLLFLYADDFTIFARSRVDMVAKMKALKEYCDINLMTVNASKTKIVIFRKGGKLAAKDKCFVFKGESIEVTNSFTYLGIPLSSSSLGLLAANNDIS